MIRSLLSLNNDPREYELESKRIESFMSVLLLAAIILLLAVIVLQLIIFPIPDHSDYILWTMEGVFILFYIINRKLNSRLAGLLFLSTLWIAVTLLIITSGGIKDVSVIAYILCFLIAINIMRFWQALLSGLLTIISVWIIAIFEQRGYITPDHATPISYAVNYTIILVLIGTILYMNRTSLMKSYRIIQEEFNERFNAQKELQNKELIIRGVFDSAHEFIGLLNKEGIVLDINKTALEFSGVELSEVVGKPFWETIWWSTSHDEKMMLIDAIKKAGKGGFIRQEVTHKDSAGLVHYFDFTLKPVFDEKGDVTYLIPEAHDISEIKKATNILSESQNRFRTLSSISTEGIMIHRNGIIIDSNQAFANLFGYSGPDDIIGKNGLEFLPFTNESRKAIIEHFNSNSNELFDVEIINLNGNIIPAETKGIVISYMGNESRLVYMRDISTRKKLEESKKEHIRNIEFLSNSAMSLIELSLKDDFFQHISQKLIELIPGDGIIALSEYDYLTDSYLIKKIAGRNFDIEKARKTLNFNPLALDGKFPPEVLKLLSSGKLHKMVADTSGFNKKVPDETKQKLYDFITSGNLYMMGFVKTEKVVGALAVVLPREIEIPDLKIIEAFGNQVAILLEKRKAEETLNAALERNKREQAVISTIATLPQIPGFDTSGYYTQLTSIAAKAIEVERVSVWLYNEKQTGLECVNLYEYSTGRHSSGQLLSESDFKNELDALTKVKYIDANNPVADPRTKSYAENYLTPLKITSKLDAVITGGAGNLGILCFEHIERKHNWEPDEIAFACQLADQIALKLLDEKRRLAEKNLQYQSRLQELLMNISSKYINLPIDKFESTINESMMEMVEFVEADRCYIFEYDFKNEYGNATYEWHREGISSILDDYHMQPLAVAEGWDYKKHQKGKTIWIPDIDGLPPSWFTEKQQKETVKSKLAVPLMNSGDCIGFVGFDWTRKHHSYSGVEHQLLIFFANLLLTIQQRKQAGDALQKSEEKFRQLVENMNDVFFILDTDGIVTYISPSAKTLFKEDFATLIGHSFSEIIYPDDLDKLTLEFRETLDNKPAPREFRYFNKDNQICWAQTSSIPIMTDGKVIGIRGIFSDITRRKKDEESLRKLSLAVEQSPASIIITDLSGDIEYVNPRFTSITGYTIDEVKGKNPRILKSGQTKKEDYFDLWSNIIEGKEWRGEFLNRKKNGDLYWEAVSISPIINEKGTVTHYLAVKEDITDKKESTRKIFDTIIETEERERQRYSHELHDGLGPIMSTIKLYFQLLAEDPETEQKVIIISRVGSCIDEAIQTIKEISYNLSSSVLNSFGVIPGIHNFINRLNETKKLRINLNTNVERRFDKNTEITIYRILTELINNTLKYANASRTDINLHYSEKDLLLRLEYTDNGSGFDLEEVLSKRTGLGLSNIYQRVKTLNGEINIISSPGNGIQVSIELKEIR